MTRQVAAASIWVFAVLPSRPICSLSLGAQYAMAQRSRRQIYETAFDSKPCYRQAEKKGDEGGDLIDRIAKHPILQLLRRRPRHHGQHVVPPGCHRGRAGPGGGVVASTSSDPKFQVGVYTPKGRRRDRAVAPRPARSASTHYISEQRARPIGLSKSDDEILNRGSDSGEDERFEDYVEDARELSADLRTAHMHVDDYFLGREATRRRPPRSEMSKSQAIAGPPRPPLGLRSPPGTAPLPVKFQKTPLAETPSSWFSPPRQKDLNLPVKKTLLGGGAAAPYGGSQGLDASMEVLLDASSRRELKGCKYWSADSVSSLESLRSSMSSKSNESAVSKTSLGSDSSPRPLSLAASSAPQHRSLIPRFQILSPISDKSQEPSSENGCSPQDAPQQQQLLLLPPPPRPPARDIRDDFRNVHHILPGPPPSREGDAPGGSDSGISVEYHRPKGGGGGGSRGGHQHPQQQQQPPFGDLPFDMPKLRRRLAQAKTSLSSSNSSLSSLGEGNQRLAFHPTANPAVSRLQISETRSGTSSSNSSDWDTRSSAESSDDQGTPKLRSKDAIHNRAKSGLALDLGCAAMAIKGERVDVKLPLMKQGWYHGALSRTEAEATLRPCSEGSYVVRSLDVSRHEYSLGLKSARGYMHLRIQFDCKTGHYMLGRGTTSFPSVPHMIQHHSTFRLPIKGAEHMVLLHPVMHETL